MTKYASEDTTPTPPPALLSLFYCPVCVKHGNTDIHTSDIICRDKPMTVKPRPDAEAPLPLRAHCQCPIHASPSGLKRASELWDAPALQTSETWCCGCTGELGDCPISTKYKSSYLWHRHMSAERERGGHMHTQQSITFLFRLPWPQILKVRRWFHFLL